MVPKIPIPGLYIYLLAINEILIQVLLRKDVYKASGFKIY